MNRASGVAALTCLLAGCASVADRYGTRAVYRPDLRGYVVARDPEEREPDRLWTLRHPIQGNKLRCEEDVLFWRPVLERSIPMADRDASATNRAVLWTLPLTIPAALLALPMIGLESALKAPDGASLREDAAGKSPDDDLALLALAGARGDMSVLVRLGELLERQGRRDDAEHAWLIFLFYYGSPSEQYAVVEQRLAALGSLPKPCRSQGPVELHWRE